MAKDTKRDRVWRAALDLAEDPPGYELCVPLSKDYDDWCDGFTKADVRKAAGGDVSERTVHDVVMTMIDYGILEMVKEPSYLSVWDYPSDGDRTPVNLYGYAD